MVDISYDENIRRGEGEVSVLTKKVNTHSLLRLVVILAGGGGVFMLFQMNNIVYVLSCSVAILLSFFYLVFRQSKLEKLRDEKLAYLKVNKNEMTLREGGVNMYNHGDGYEDAKHPYLSDLDIFGSHSLFTKINRCATHDGNDKLASWLTSPATYETILDRQDAVRELAADTSFNQQMQTKLLFNLGAKVNLRFYLEEYFKGETMTFGNGFMKMYLWIAPILIGGGILYSVFVANMMTYVILLALVHLFWTMALAGRVSLFSNRIDKVGATMMAYSNAIKLIEDRVFSSKLNKDLQQQLAPNDEVHLSSALYSLGKLIDKLDARNNLLVGALLNMFMLWDFKQVLAIVNWKKTYAQDTLRAFEVMAHYEALLSLAVLSVNHPNWTFPVLKTDPLNDPIIAKGIEHPLIPIGQSVANDYMSTDHRVALVTGSNMAGKSTFLRTIGINAVLAYSGAAVCAVSLSLPIYRIVTYMRIKDNLNESTSTFKAELDRMKFILGIVEVSQDSFFLIDEMLRGTNSVDKYLGSKAIIKKLLDMNGKGMVATHDLQLSKLGEEYPDQLVNYHFDIQIREGEMLFDYKLKDGECRVFNASMLLRGIGIDVNEA